VIRAGDTGRRRHAISVALRAPDTNYETATVPELRAEVGGEVRLLVRVCNLSVNEAALQLVVEGVPDGWADIYPDRVQLASEQQYEGEVSVHFPRTRTDSWPIRVVVLSSGRRVASAAAVVNIVPQAVLSLELDPVELRTRRRARTEVRVVNTGNAPADVELAARDNDGRLGFRLTPERVHVAPGAETHAGLEVTAPRRRWLGGSSVAPLMVEAQGGPSRATALGTFQQRSLFPRWALVVPVLACAAAAYIVSRPTEVAVPHVTGLTIKEARAKLEHAGLVARSSAMPASDPRHPQPGVVAQEPDPGEEVKDGDAVTISYESGSGIATVTPKVTSSSVAPPPGESEPLAYVRENRIFVRFPGEAEQSIAGTVGVQSMDPTWNPATGEVAYVRRRSPEAEAEVVAVDPRAPGGERGLTTPGRSYLDPAFSQSGTLLALIADDGSGYGGQLCVDVLPGTDPGCRDDSHWHYADPAFADDSAIYVLRRRDSTARSGGWDELVRVSSDSFDVDPTPIATGDLRSLAVARDGRIALVVRGEGDVSSHVEVLSPEGQMTASEPGPSSSCSVAWSGDNLVVSRGTCSGADGQIVQVNPTALSAAPTVLLEGDEPSVAP
jgi:PASTA domain